MDDDGKDLKSNDKASKGSSTKKSRATIRGNGGDAATTVSVDAIANSSWININNEYLFPKSFIENCVVFVQRSGSTLIIRTIEEYSDLTTVLSSEQAAIDAIRDICTILNEHELQCNIDFGGNPLEISE